MSDDHGCAKRHEPKAQAGALSMAQARALPKVLQDTLHMPQSGLELLSTTVASCMPASSELCLELGEVQHVL